MATFISKEEIMAGVRQIPPVNGATPPASNSPLGIFNAGGYSGGGGNTIDQLERILSQINGILTQVNSIRNNPTTRAIIGGANATAQTGAPATFIESAPRPIATATPQATQTAQPTPAKEKRLEINEEGIKEFIAAVMGELDKMPDEVKNLKISSAVMGYNMIGEQRAALENNAIGKFREWLPKLVKQVD